MRIKIILKSYKILGKGKIKNTRFDILGGLGAYVTLISRISTMSYKVGDTLKMLNSGAYGSLSSYDVAVSFLTNKTSPIGSVIRDLLKGKSFEGKPLGTNSKEQTIFTAKYIADSLITPLLINDTVDAYDKGSGNVALVLGTTASSIFGAISLNL